MYFAVSSRRVTFGYGPTCLPLFAHLTVQWTPAFLFRTVAVLAIRNIIEQRWLVGGVVMGNRALSGIAGHRPSAYTPVSSSSYIYDVGWKHQWQVHVIAWKVAKSV